MVFIWKIRYTYTIWLVKAYKNMNILFNLFIKNCVKFVIFKMYNNFTILRLILQFKCLPLYLLCTIYNDYVNVAYIHMFWYVFAIVNNVTVKDGYQYQIYQDIPKWPKWPPLKSMKSDPLKMVKMAILAIWQRVPSWYLGFWLLNNYPWYIQILGTMAKIAKMAKMAKLTKMAIFSVNFSKNGQKWHFPSFWPNGQNGHFPANISLLVQAKDGYMADIVYLYL